MKLITKWGLVFGVAVFAAVSLPMAQKAISHANEFSPQQLVAWRAKGPVGNTLNPPKDDLQWTQLCAALDFIRGQKGN